MLIIWTIIPFILFGIIGVSESFAEEMTFIEQIPNEASESSENKMKNCFAKNTSYSSDIVGFDRQIYPTGFHYTITNGSLLMDDQSVDSLKLLIDSCDDGYISISLDRTFFKSVSADIDTCSITNESFSVTVDGYESSYEEIEKGSVRTLKIDFSKDSQEIQIIGNDRLSSGIDELFRKSCWTPREQVSYGYPNIACKDDMVMIHRPYEEGQRYAPACVTPNTAEKLVERGWVLP